MDEYNGSYESADNAYTAHNFLKDDIRSLEGILEREYDYEEGSLDFPKELTK